MIINSKTKKVLIMTGLAAACVGMCSLVVARAGADAQPETESSAVSSEIVFEAPNPIVVPSSNSETVDSAFVPSSGAAASAPLTTISKPVSKPAKPAPPTGAALTNKDKKPSQYHSGSPRKNTKKSGGTSPTSPQKPDNPTTGGNTDGNHDPIFGDKKGTGGQAIIDKKTSSDGDIHKQVGIM